VLSHLTPPPFRSSPRDREIALRLMDRLGLACPLAGDDVLVPSVPLHYGAGKDETEPPVCYFDFQVKIIYNSI
jgi:hypothetical protein